MGTRVGLRPQPPRLPLGPEPPAPRQDDRRGQRAPRGRSEGSPMAGGCESRPGCTCSGHGLGGLLPQSHPSRASPRQPPQPGSPPGPWSQTRLYQRPALGQGCAQPSLPFPPVLSTPCPGTAAPRPHRWDDVHLLATQLSAPVLGCLSTFGGRCPARVTGNDDDTRRAGSPRADSGHGQGDTAWSGACAARRPSHDSSGRTSAVSCPSTSSSLVISGQEASPTCPA